MNKLGALGAGIVVAGVLGAACGGASSAQSPYQAGQAFAKAYYTAEGTVLGLRDGRHCIDIASQYTGRVPDDQEGTANEEPAAANTGEGAAAAGV